MGHDLAVDAYISGLDGPERNTLVTWRERCLELPGSLVEGIPYGMPCCSREGETELAFAAHKRHLALYMMRVDVMATHRDRLEGYRVGKGCITPTRASAVASGAPARGVRDLPIGSPGTNFM